MLRKIKRWAVHCSKQACVQLPTSSDIVALPAFAAARRAAARLLLSAGQQSIDISCSPRQQQQTRSSGVQWANATD